MNDLINRLRFIADNTHAVIPEEIEEVCDAVADSYESLQSRLAEAEADVTFWQLAHKDAVEARIKAEEQLTLARQELADHKESRRIQMDQKDQKIESLMRELEKYTPDVERILGDQREVVSLKPASPDGSEKNDE